MIRYAGTKCHTMKNFVNVLIKLDIVKQATILDQFIKYMNNYTREDKYGG